MSEPEENMKKWLIFLKNYLPLSLMGAAVVVVAFFMLTGELTIGELLQYAQDRPVLCGAILLTLYAIKGFSVVIIYSVLAAAAGVVFPMPVAIILNLIGTAICLTVSYAVGYYTKTESLEQRLDKHPKIKHYFENAKDFGFGFSYTLHVLGLSTEVLGVLFGLMRLEYWKYMVSSMIAISPGMICCTIVGSDLNFRSPVFWAILGCDLVIITTCTIYTKRRLDRKKDQ